MINSRNISDYFYVYLHTKASDGVPFYVGKGTGTRAYRTNHRSRWWSSVVAKYGYEVKIIDSNLLEDEAFELEMFLISELGRADLNLGPLVNMTSGGDGVSGYKFTEEQRKTLSDAQKGEKSHMFGKKGELCHFFGTKHTEETKAKMSIAQKGKKRSVEIRQAQSSRMAGIKHSKETIHKIAEALYKKVICYTDSGINIEFNSLSDGAKYFNTCITNISQCCNGTRSSAGKHPDTKEKLHWRRADGEQ